MALIKCPECNAMVSSSAESFPKCGYPILKDVKERYNSIKMFYYDERNVLCLHNDSLLKKISIITKARQIKNPIDELGIEYSNSIDEDNAYNILMENHNILQEYETMSNDFNPSFLTGISDNSDLDYWILKAEIETAKTINYMTENQKQNNFSAIKSVTPFGALGGYIVVQALKESDKPLSELGILMADCNRNGKMVYAGQPEIVAAIRFDLLERGVITKVNPDSEGTYFYELKNEITFNKTDIKFIEMLKKEKCTQYEVYKVAPEIAKSLFPDTFIYDDYRTTYGTIEEQIKEEEKEYNEIFNPEVAKMMKDVEQKTEILHQKLKVPNQVEGAKCPVCGKETVRKITTKRKATSIGLFGIFSSNLGKTMECTSCGYKW